MAKNLIISFISFRVVIDHYQKEVLDFLASESRGVVIG